MRPRSPRPKPDLAEAVADRVDHDVAGVGDPVHPRDLVAVVGGDRDLDDPAVRAEQLQDDLGVEVEPVAVADERQVGQRRHPVGAVARVPLAEADPGDHVLGAGEDAVADELVQRHPTAASAARIEHARPEHGVDVPVVGERRQQVGHLLGRVLTVAVEEDDDVPTVVDGVAVPGLLVAAVAEVGIVPHDRERDVGAVGDVIVSDVERRIARVVVHHEHFDQFAAQRRRDAVEHPPQRRLGVVGDDEHTDLRSLHVPTAAVDGNPSAELIGGRPIAATLQSGRSRRPST